MRLEKLESRLVSQFLAMDKLVGELQSTSSFLQQQLANMPIANLNKNNS